MREYSSNSYRSKEQSAEEKASNDKKIEKVVNGKVKTKKNDGRNLANIFISEDAGNVKSYLFMDVFVPALKKLVSDVVRDGIDMLLYGKTSGSKSKSANYVSYSTYSDGGRARDRRESDSRVRTRFEYDDLVFESRGDAEVVRKQMEDAIDRYGLVTVADMYDMAELTAPYTASKYGWSSIRNAEVVRVKDGYIIKLPKASPID